jgi:hypothetical protein
LESQPTSTPRSIKADAMRFLFIRGSPLALGPGL